MALEIHSIPAMSSEVERLFSRYGNWNYLIKLLNILIEIQFVNSGKTLITDCRNRLGDDVIKAIECLKSWRKAGLQDEKELDAVELMMKDLDEQDQLQKQKGGAEYTSSAGGSVVSGFE